MSTTGSVDWYGDELLIAVDNVAEDVARVLAFRIEAEAKANAPVDTGFHRNAIYTITRYGAEGPPDADDVDAQKKQLLAPTPGLPRDVLAGVHAAASYAIFAEFAQPHLYPAAERVAKIAGGVIKQIAADKGLT